MARRIRQDGAIAGVASVSARLDSLARFLAVGGPEDSSASSRSSMMTAPCSRGPAERRFRSVRDHRTRPSSNACADDRSGFVDSADAQLGDSTTPTRRVTRGAVARRRRPGRRMRPAGQRAGVAIPGAVRRVRPGRRAVPRGARGVAHCRPAPQADGRRGAFRVRRPRRAHRRARARRGRNAGGDVQPDGRDAARRARLHSRRAKSVTDLRRARRTTSSGIGTSAPAPSSGAKARAAHSVRRRRTLGRGIEWWSDATPSRRSRRNHVAASPTRSTPTRRSGRPSTASAAATGRTPRCWIAATCCGMPTARRAA